MNEDMKLLPCPICQSKAYSNDNTPMSIERDIDSEQEFFYGVHCTSCGLTVDSLELSRNAVEVWNALPRALVWTTDPPTEPGHYWCRYTGSDKTTWSPAYIPAVDDLQSYSMDRHDQIEWAGPIQMPKENIHD